MRRTMLVLMLVGLVFCFGAIAKDFKASKFKVTYEIVYNAITLDEAAAIERNIKKRFDDACKVNVEVKKIEGSFINDDAVDFDLGSVITEGSWIVVE